MWSSPMGWRTISLREIPTDAASEAALGGIGLCWLAGEAVEHAASRQHATSAARIIPALEVPSPSLSLCGGRGTNCFQLVPGAVAWRLVLAPPEEARGVAEAIALEVIELDLTDELRRDVDPLRLTALRPATKPARRAAKTEALAAL